MSVVNALSETLDLEIWRNGQVYQQTPSGAARRPLEMTGTTKRRGTKVTFKPDHRLRDDRLQFRHTRPAAARTGLPERGVLITLDDERDGKATSFTTKAASSRSSRT